MPDFLIIGAMKCATTALHEQLARQPGIFMTEPKEPYFFSNDEVWAKGLGWYSSLYDDAALGDICGESSTHYTKLPTYPKTIMRMQAHVPDTKLVYVIRHPVDRLISHYIHDWTERIINEPIDEAVANHAELVFYSKYAMQILPFLENYGTENVLLVFFEHLLLEPQIELERIARFIGYSNIPIWTCDNAANVSLKRMRRSPFLDAVVWNALSTWLRRTFVPQSARDWIKRFWQMKERPQLGKQNLHDLEHIFDKDLAKLSQWIDVDLSCDTFKQVSKHSMPEWLSSSSKPF